jgi:hypothetical protein
VPPAASSTTSRIAPFTTQSRLMRRRVGPVRSAAAPGG